MALKILLLGLAGGLGTLTRYVTGNWVARWAGGGFPWPTFVVNMAGCFLFGLVVALFERTSESGSDVRLILLTGFMGAFTTYSTYAFQTAELFKESHWGTAAANLIAQNAVGVALVLLGLYVGKIGHAG
jgi:CrcB protein